MRKEQGKSLETSECPACGLRFRIARPNACTACGRVHCRKCLKVFRDEGEEDIEARFITLCPACEGSVAWRVEAQEVSPVTWEDYDRGR
ncbi:MAG: FYVE zinc finger domain-containing protein [Candidatus Tectomicrobia bacterium]|nr:FYVE zinc finger domain-containing protein [Candidatus Tectomicrobia bacterium]